MSGSPRLLVVRLSSLGDVVMATSVLTSLRERNPAAHITVLTFEPYSPLFRNHPCVDEVLAPPRTLEGMGAWFRYGLSLRDRRFDAVLDLHYNWRTLALGAALFPVPVRRWRRDHHRRRQLLGAGPCGRSLPHMVERYHAALGPWGSGRVDAPHVVGSRSDWEAARELLERLGGAGGRWLGLVPVARWNTKRWPEDRWAELAARWVAQSRGSVMVFFGTADQNVQARFSAAGAGSEVHEVVGLPLGQVTELLRRMEGVVAGDTGLMHLAASTGAPTLGLYGPTSTAFGVAPYGPKHRSVGLQLECRPCSLHGQDRCPLGHHRCMRELSVERVWNELMEMIAGAGTRAGRGLGERISPTPEGTHGGT